MARVTGPSRRELDARADLFAARVRGAIRATLRDVAETTQTVDDLARIQTVWRNTVNATLAPRLRVAWDVAVRGVVAQLEKLNAREHPALVAAGFVIPKVSNPLAETFLANATNRLVAIGDVVWYTARGEMLTGMQLGEGVAELKDRVIASANVSVRRAEVIARTEVNSAMNNGAYEQMKALDVPTIKEWIATDDSRTRESHAEVDGEEIGGDEKFIVGGYAMDHPHDLNGPPSQTINCRCTLAWEIDDDEDYYADALAAAGDFDEAKHKRDGKGRFAKKAGGSVPKTKKLKVTHVLVHKKYAPGTIIAVSGSDSKRVVWDGNKYLLQEKQADGGWATTETAIKTKAYVAVNKFDDDWREPAEDDSLDGDGTADVASPTLTKSPKTSAKKSGSSLKITHMLVHQKHEPGTVIAENGAGDKRVRWDGKKYELQVKPPLEDKWFTEKTAIKSKAYVEINAYDDDWRTPGGVDADIELDDIPDDFFNTPLEDLPQTGPKFPTKSKVKHGPTKKPFTPPAAATSESPSSTASPESIAGYKKIGGQAGSNTGGLYQAPDGEKWYVKAPKTDGHARNEYLGNRLYQAAGVNVPQVELAQLGADSPLPGKTGLGVKSKIVEGERNLQHQVLNSKSFKSKLYEDFAVDAWLGNWDAVGLAYDNIITDGNGDPLRIDAGGSLLFRAQGMAKGSAFGNKVSEIDSLRDHLVNPQSANVYGDVTDDDIRKGVAKIEAIQPEEIDALVDEAGFTGKTAKHLKDTLKARRQDLVNRYGSGAKKPTPQPSAAPTPAVAPTSTPVVESTPAPAASSPSAGVAPKSMFDLTKVKDDKKGGAVFTDPAGVEYRVTPAQSETHARNQFLAANLYYFAGVAVEETQLVDIDPAKLPGKSGVGVKTKVIPPSAVADVNDPFFLTEKSKNQIALGFAVDAWLGNWNVAGANGENLIISKSGDVYRSKVGGSLLFRANGGLKNLGDSVNEIDSLRDPNVNPTTAKVFADVSDDDIRAAVANIEKITPKTIDFIVDQSGLTGNDAAKLKQKLKARRQDLIDRFGSLATKPVDDEPATPAPAPSSQPTASNALGGAKTFTALQRAKVQSIFNKHNLKWYNKTDQIYSAALEVSKTHSDLTIGDALDIMDQSLQKKTGNPFRTKVEKWLQTKAGKNYVLAVGGSAPLGSTSSKVPGTGAVTANVPAQTQPAVKFASALPRELTPKDADVLQERMNKAWPPPWTNAQRLALARYTGDDYTKINGCLRGLTPCTPGVQSTVNQLRKAMKPSTDNVVVYRKTNPSAFGVSHAIGEISKLGQTLSDLVGKTFEDKGVTSTSITKGMWNGLVHMEIEVPEGAKLAWVKRISKHQHENEIVLAPGTRFEVISVTPIPDYPGDNRQLMKLRVVVDEELV